MARRDDAKDAALAASRTLNSDPQNVTDPAFTAGGFFDPADLLQVKYEMVRQVEVDGVPVSAAAARVRVRAPERLQRPGGAGRRRAGRADPGQAGPQGRPQAHRAGAGPPGGPAGAGSPADPGELAAQAAQRFGIQVHPRSVRRALERRLADRDAGTAGPAAPKSGRHG